MTAVTYEQVAELPVVVEEYALDVLSRRVSSGFRRFTTVFGLAGGGHPGVGEDVTYEATEHRLLQRAGPALPLAGTWTLEAFSRHLDQLDTFPDRPPADEVSRAYRRWALESAALDLPLRQAGRPLHELLGRLPAPVRFVVSLNLGQAPTCAPLLSRRAACGALRFKLDATSESGDELLECLAASGCVDAIDFKGVYQDTLSAARTDASLYQRVAEALPHAWLEEPDLTDPAARAALGSQRPRVTWDAPIHSAADIAAQRWPPRTSISNRRDSEPCERCSTPTTTTPLTASAPTAAANTNSARAAARLSTWRRCFTPTRPTTSHPPALISPPRHATRRVLRSPSPRTRPASADSPSRELAHGCPDRRILATRRAERSQPLATVQRRRDFQLKLKDAS